MANPPISILGVPGLDPALRNGGFQLISAGGTDMGGGSSATQTNGSSTFRWNFIPVATASRLRLLYGNFNSNNSLGENRGSARCRRQAWFEFLVGTGQESSETGERIPVTANNGQDWIITDCGALTLTDPASVKAGKGTPLFVRNDTYVPGDNYLMPLGRVSHGGTGPGCVNDGTGYINPTPTGASGTVSQSTYNIDCPIGVFGYVNSYLPSVAIFGDSREAASFDGGWGFAGGGVAERAFSNQLARNFTYPVAPTTPYLKMTRPGETLAAQTDPAQTDIRRKIMGYVSTVYLEAGVNDRGSGLAAMKANALAQAIDALEAGLFVIRTTLLPVTTSTDNWKTLANQTVDSLASTTTWPFNGWLRDTSAAGFSAQTGYPSRVAIFDAAAAIEVNSGGTLTLNGGYWPAAQNASLLTGILAGSQSSRTITDSSKTWMQDQWRGYCVRMTSGAAAGQCVAIYFNTSTQLNVTSNWTTPPSAGDAYEIYDPWTLDGIHGSSIANAKIATALASLIPSLVR